MSEILSSISKTTKELNLLDGILHFMYVFDREGKHILSYRFGSASEFNHTLIGGLVATVEEFAGLNESPQSRSISFKKIKLVFKTRNEFSFVFVVDPNYPVTQFESAMSVIIESMQQVWEMQDYGKNVNGLALTMQIIQNMIREDIEVEMDLGELVSIYPYKLQEIASETLNDLLEGEGAEDEEEVDEGFPIAEIKSTKDSAIVDKVDALDHLLSRFVSSFSDIKAITMIRTRNDGSLEQITKGTLPKFMQKNVLNTIMGMIDVVSILLEQEEEQRTLDLDDYYLYLEQVSLTSFIYVIVESVGALDLVKPIISALIANINNLFPSEF